MKGANLVNVNLIRFFNLVSCLLQEWKRVVTNFEFDGSFSKCTFGR